MLGIVLGAWQNPCRADYHYVHFRDKVIGAQRGKVGC